MEQKILKFCIERGFLLDKELLDAFNEIEDTEIVKILIEKIYQITQKRIITKNFFNDKNAELIFSNIPEENRKYVEKLKIKLGLNIEISKELSFEEEIDFKNIHDKKYEININKFPDVKVVTMPSIFGKKIEVDDFSKYFRNRFMEIRNILQENMQLSNLISIGKISGNRQGVTIIGIVSNKRITKNKNILLELEDFSGKILTLININKPELFKKAEDIVLDEVIAVKCSGSREMVFVNEIFFPEASLYERKKTPEEIYVAFTGDTHFGSMKFQEQSFLKFIDFLNGKIKTSIDFNKIKYLFIVGDIVDGVGVYPGQEKELMIKDVEDQYVKAAELLGKIRKDIKIIICPGNHDAVRIMEPQPILNEKYAWPLYELDNVILTTNPSIVNIASTKEFNGLNVLLYHGYSFNYYANNVNSLRMNKAYSRPEIIREFLLKKRHLAPTHASTLYFPHEKDPHLIRNIPDIFFTGDLHKGSVAYYNNILSISSSCWQEKTEFQEKMGHEPDVGKVPILNLKTRAITILDFEKKDD